MKSLIKNSLKITLAGGFIAATWFAALTTEPDESAKPTVAEARADIGTLGLGADGKEFTRAMTALGLKPRPYDLNGNVMYFAAGTTDLMPAEIEKEISSAMIEYGINSKPTTEMPATSTAARGWKVPSLDEQPSAAGLSRLAQQAEANAAGLQPQAEATMNGELVTTVRERTIVRMESTLWKKSGEEIVEELKSDSPKLERSSHDLHGGYRFIEAIYDPGDGMTDISAVWTAEDFDSRKMNNTAFVQQEPDPNVPACMGCKRRYRMQSLAKDEPLRANEWHTTSGLQQTYEFYTRAMGQRGWSVSGSQRILDEAAQIVPKLDQIEGKIVNLEKEGKAMQIVLLPDDVGGTHVFSKERFEGASATFTQGKLPQ